MFKNNILVTLKLKSIIIFFMLVSLSFFGILSAQAENKKIGKAIVVRGTVNAILEKDKADPRKLRRGSSIFLLEQIISEAKSSVKLRLEDGTLLSLKPHTKMVMAEYMFKKGGANNKSVVKLIKGGVKSMSGLINKGNPEAYKIKTKVATIGIRGTLFELNFDANTEQTYGYVKVGTLTITSKNGKVKTLRGGDPKSAFMTDGDDMEVMTIDQLNAAKSPCGSSN